MPRMAEEERVQRARQWADDYRGARDKMAALARRRFWLDRHVPEGLAEQIADALPMTPEQLSREVERYDTALPTERLQMIDVARRLFAERGLAFPIV